MKKTITLTAVAALMLVLAAGSASANNYRRYNSNRNNDSKLMVSNMARVTNEVETEAETGENALYGKYVRGGRIVTGSANAASVLTNDVNRTEAGCDCYDNVKVRNRASVDNYLETEADSGDNEISARRSLRGGMIRTGNAGAASDVMNVVNTVMLGGGVQ